MTANEKMVQRIDRALPCIPDYDEAKRVLKYVRSQITPEGFARRDEYHQDIGHLLDVAATRLKPYEKTKEGHPHDH